MNWNSVHLWLPILIKSKANAAYNIDAAVITVNIFFAHWIKEIKIKHYGGDLHILPTGRSTNIYQYSDTMLKHMSKNALETFEKILLYRNVYRILLRFLVDMGMVNFPVKLNIKIIYTLETNLNRLSKSVKKLTAIPNAPDVQ